MLIILGKILIFFLCSNKLKKFDEIDESFQEFVDFDLKRLYDKLRGKEFYFIVVKKKYNYKYSFTYIVDEIYFNKEQAIERILACLKLENLVLIEKYIDLKKEGLAN